MSDSIVFCCDCLSAQLFVCSCPHQRRFKASKSRTFFWIGKDLHVYQLGPFDRFIGLPSISNQPSVFDCHHENQCAQQIQMKTIDLSDRLKISMRRCGWLKLSSINRNDVELTATTLDGKHVVVQCSVPRARGTCSVSLRMMLSAVSASRTITMIT